MLSNQRCRWYAGGGYANLRCKVIGIAVALCLTSRLAAQVEELGPVIEQIGSVSWSSQLNLPGGGRDNWGTPVAESLPGDNAERGYDFGVAARAWYLNDQRIEFTGMEGSFGVDGVLRGEAFQWCGDVLGVVYGELLLNQPFDRNILADTPERVSYASNFQRHTVDISQLSVVAVKDNLEFEFGRFVTPFGRFYGLSFHNDLVDLPFLRNEVILLRETGAQLRWNPSFFRSTIAITNGGPQRDSNSSKSLIARCGVDLDRWSAGASVKTQDGIGSEGQKEFNEYAGIDAMFRITPTVMISGEYVVDHHGLRRNGVTLNDITWGRSLYNRQLNKAHHIPIDGRGWYFSLIGQQEQFDWSLGYGHYLPEQLGDPTHDTPVSRGIGQIAWHLRKHTDLYTSLVFENAVDGAMHEPRSRGFMILSGVQIRF